VPTCPRAHRRNPITNRPGWPTDIDSDERGGPMLCWDCACETDCLSPMAELEPVPAPAEDDVQGRLFE